MVTGVETAGLVLALLPFFVNSLSAYADGIETLRLFRAGKYSRQLRDWASTLETQRTIVQNTVTELLNDFLDDDETIAAMHRDPNHERWKDPGIEGRMRAHLGSSYGPYTRTMELLHALLLDIEARLGPGVAVDTKVTAESRNLFKDRLRAYKHVFSKAIYDRIFDQIDRANTLLQTLTDQKRRSNAKSSTKLVGWKTLLRLNRLFRKHIAGLYETLIMDQRWNCRTQDHSHMLNLRLESYHDSLQDELQTRKRSCSTLAFLSDGNYTSKASATVQVTWREHIIEAEVSRDMYEETIPSHTDVKQTKSADPEVRAPTTSAKTLPAGKKKKTVGFAVLDPEVSRQDQTLSNASLVSRELIADLCAAIVTCQKDAATRKHLGCLASHAAGGQFFDLFVIQAAHDGVSMRALRDILMIARGQRLLFEVPIITRRDCLLLAVNLASNVLKLQGNWLRSGWSLQDIVFLESVEERSNKTESQTLPKYVIETPYLSWSLAQEDPAMLRMAALSLSRPSTMIKCPSLFPLGLALVELALWKPLSEIPSQEDEADPHPAVANLKKATRLLPVISGELGPRYKDVVEECLWRPSSRPQDDDLESEEFQTAVYQYIVLPLEKELRAFDGN